MIRSALSANVLLAALHWAVPAAHAADNCEAVREGIETKIRAAGVASFTLEVIDAAASAPDKAAGKVVGNCARGARIIVYRRSESGAAGEPANRRPPSPALITECKDGSAPVDGQCRKK